MTRAGSATIRIGIETVDRKVFASALDWPGWSRSAKTEEAALDALVAYAPRYSPVANDAGYPLPADPRWNVTQRLNGDASTAFGIPSVTFDADREAVSAGAATRLAAIVSATWDTIDGVGARAPAELRKGPRGGGRDRDKVLAHVNEADNSYARSIGLKLPEPRTPDAVRAMRHEMLGVLSRPSDGTPLDGRRWTQRYASRRIAWHALDHAWEIEDRSDLG